LKRFRFRPTYSNVVATLALFFALAGGAWAATQLPKESVGSTQLAKGAVTPAKLSAQAKEGFTGPAGPQGALGPRGNEGQRGENGAAGATGPQGIRGATGATGATGSRGELGEAGLRGERGPIGDTGLEGPRGLEGRPGLEGKQGAEGETGPSDAYVAISDDDPLEVVHELQGVPLELALPAGEYVIQAVLTVQAEAKAGATADCSFMEGAPGITLGPSNNFSASVRAGAIASLVGTTTAVATEDSEVDVFCEAAGAGTSFLIPGEAAHLTATKVGTLHTLAE
jgi:Collagen triple helix repeat (20 copies)